MARLQWWPRQQGDLAPEEFPEIPGETLSNAGLLRVLPPATLRRDSGSIPGLSKDKRDGLLQAAWGSDDLMLWPREPATSSRLEVRLGWGSGQIRSPFSCRAERLFELFREHHLSPRILGRLRHHESYFEHAFSGENDTSATPTHIEIAASNFEHDGFLCLLRSEIATSHTKCILFLKPCDPIRSSPLQEHTVISHLEAHADILQRHPLLILNVVLTLLQTSAHDFVHWRTQLYDIEARIGVSSHARRLQQNYYSEVEYNFNRLNADLTSTARSIADNELSVSTMLEHARAYERVSGICERLKRQVEAGTKIEEPIYDEQHEEIQSTITRAEIYLAHTKMAHDVVQSLTAALYNRINKSDTRSMKTIAVVTLFFLPATFVSAVFSTGIFNFHAREDPARQRVISRYGWIYLLIMLLLTMLTLTTWSIWYTWGERWLDALRAHDGKVRRTAPKEDGSFGTNNRW